MQVKVRVKYKYGKNKPDTSTNWSGMVNGKSESAVMQKLKEKHKGCEILIEKIEWA